MAAKMLYLILLSSTASSVFAEKSQWNFQGKQTGKQLYLLVEKDGQLVLEVENLEKLLCGKNVNDTPVAVISIAGAFRMGKSFTLNLFLKYFQNNTESGWLTKHSASRLDEGISWRGGAAPHTTGIVAWSEPLLFKNSDGSEMAIILLDTQGNFDHGTEKEKSVRIFALSTLFSSLQIFNVAKQIQSNDFEHLETFVEYSKLPSLEQSSGIEAKKKHFQDLLFLVRDWANSKDFAYGAEGGKEYLENLKSKYNSSGKTSVQQYLDDAFSNVNCYLMPEPAAKVRMSGDHEAPLVVADLGKKFAEYVEKLVEEFINPNALALKSIGYDVATGNDLFNHVKYSAEILLSKKGPVLPDEMELIAKYNCKIQQEKALSSYTEIVLKRINTIKNWEQFDEILVEEEKEKAKIQYEKNTWYGKGTIPALDENLDKDFSDKDEYFKLKMNERRETLVREHTKKWKREYSKRLEERGWLNTPESTLDKVYYEALANLEGKKDRDPISIEHLLHSAKEHMDYVYKKNKEDAANSNRNKKILTSALSAVGVVQRQHWRVQ